MVFEDEAADGGSPLPGAAGLDGRTVYVDLNEDEQQDALEPAATTDSDGRYEITGVAPGSYVVRTVPLAGWTCSSPATCAQTLTLEAERERAGRRLRRLDDRHGRRRRLRRRGRQRHP